MGIGRGTLKSLLAMKREISWHQKSLLQLGRQCIYLTYKDVKECAKEFDFPLKPKIPIQLSTFKNLREKGFLDDETFFKLLGFGDVYSLDASDFENPSFVHDLNLPINTLFQSQFDFIFDGGTLEHIFHLPECFANIHKMLKQEGVVIHCSPSHNHVDHGFYMFSPTLFYDYYEANQYEILCSRVIKYLPHMSKPWKVYAYKPGNLDALSYGGFGKEMLAIWFTAKKKAHSTSNVIPQQSFYRNSWLKQNTEKETTPPLLKKKKSFFKKLIKELLLISSYHRLRRIYKDRKHSQKITQQFEDLFCNKF